MRRSSGRRKFRAADGMYGQHAAGLAAAGTRSAAMLGGYVDQGTAVDAVEDEAGRVRTTHAAS
ncbi:hypothetical protein [Streptomyces griseofuscus]|uniref:hypothetical protein n=1 Tax=Streptomyces griseofuscus TaxID=146922 RepID=UPI00380C4D08